MMDFLSGIGLIYKGFPLWKNSVENNKGGNNELPTRRRNSLEKEVEQILLDSKKEEDIIFYHNIQSDLINLQFSEKKNIQQFSFFEYDMDIEDDTIYLDEKETENIKTYHVLNVLKPKIEIYLSYTDIEFNCTFMRNLYSYAEEIGFENTIGYLLPLIQDLHFRKSKGENILMAFLDTFEKLLVYLRQYDDDHAIILNKLLPIISQILTTSKDMILCNKAVNALKFLIDNIKMDEFLSNIMPILIGMANNEKDERGQSIAIKVFSEKAAFIGGENLELYVLPLFESFAEYCNEFLRIYCINYMIPLFENMSYNIIQTKFVKIYDKLAHDSSFQIRRISCNMLPVICKTILNNNNGYNIEKHIKKEELIANNILNDFYSFTEDTGREIQFNALSIFGEFICYLDDETIRTNRKLKEYYINKINSVFILFQNRKIDANPIYKACYSFPSVLLTYCNKIKDEEERKQNWDKLKPIFLRFINSKETQIKNSIASALGDISTILSTSVVEKELSPIISDMYYSNGTKIKNVITNIIPKYLTRVKDPKIRSEFLVIYKRGFSSIKSMKGWRKKIQYIKGIKKLGDIFENEIIFEDLVGMLIELCFDAHNVIRKKTAKILSSFLLKFLLLENKENAEKKKISSNYNTENSENSEDSDKENIAYIQNGLIIIRNFGTCKHYHYRQIFIYLCKYLMTNKIIFEKHIIDLFTDLSYDKVANVRYTLSLFISTIWAKNKAEYEWIKTNQKIIEIIYRLKNDKENEVKKCLDKIEIDVNKIENKEQVLEPKDVNKNFIGEFQDFKIMFDYVPFLGKAWLKNSKVQSNESN